MNEIQKIEHHTPDLAAENINKLIQLFPEVATEVRDPQTGEVKLAVDFDALRDKLGDVAEGTRERYQFTWPGKHKAKIEAHTPITKTLRPVKERSKNWDNTQNLYIEGDNLDTLKLLRETYAGKVKLIYIDPPYNTGHDFVYRDNFIKSDQENRVANAAYNDEGDLLIPNQETDGRFHSNWCSMIYPRLAVSRDLLTNDGAIFISISDNESANLIKIMDEIYGARNRVAIICHKSRASVSNDKVISSNHDFLLFYAKDINSLESRKNDIGLSPELSNFDKDDNDGKGPYKLVPVDGPGGARKGNPYYEFLGISGYWRFSQETMSKKYQDGLIVLSGNSLYQKYYISDAQKRRKTVTTWWDKAGLTSAATKQLKKLMNGGVFETPKPVEMVLQILQMITYYDKNAIILDFFSGSGTTADAVMQMNATDHGTRKYILVQLPESVPEASEAFKQGYRDICEIGEERIRRAAIRMESLYNNEPNEALSQDNAPDLGFRVLRVDSSNYLDMRQHANSYAQEMLEFDVNSTKGNRSSLDLLFEILPTFQIEYSSSITVLSSSRFSENTVYSVNHGQLIACFDSNISKNLMHSLANINPRPSYVVLAEKGISDSATRTNFAELFKQSANSVDGQTQIRII